MIAARIGDDDATPSDAPFAELTNKLAELGYTAGDAIDGITTYAHPDGDGVRVTLDTANQQEGRVSHRHNDGDPTWMIRFTADTPGQVQRAIFHLVHRFRDTGERAVQRTATDAFDTSDDEK